MKKTAILTAAVFLTLLLFSQQINKRFAVEGVATLQNGVLNYDKFSILFGSVYNPKYNNGLKTYLLKVDAEGNFIDSIFIDMPQRIQFIPVSKNGIRDEQDSSFLFTGVSSSTTGESRMILVKADTNMNIRFAKEYDWAGNQIFVGRGLTKYHDGGYLVTGYIQYANYDLDYFLLKTDNAGNEQWRQSYGVSNLHDWGRNVLLPPNGNILLSGYSENRNQTGGFVSPRIYLVETDSLGDVLWEWQDPDTSTVLNNIIPIQDGGFIGIGSYVTFRSRWDGFRMKGYVVKFDSNKQKVWEQVYGIQSGQSRFNDIVELPDGNFLVCGALGVDINIEKYNRHGNICKFSADGNIIWQRSYIGVNSAPQCCSDNMLYDLEVLPDGSIVASGQADDNTEVNGYPYQQGWLLHIDSNGCLLPGSCGVTAIEVFPSTEGLGVGLYPNPVNNILNIQLQNFNHLPNSIQILNINGQMLLQQNVSSDEMQIDVTTLPQGMYVMQLIENNQVKAYKKFIKE